MEKRIERNKDFYLELDKKIQAIDSARSNADLDKVGNTLEELNRFLFGNGNSPKINMSDEPTFNKNQTKVIGIGISLIFILLIIVIAVVISYGK